MTTTPQRTQHHTQFHGTAQINGVDSVLAILEVARDMIMYTSRTPSPDPNWLYIDRAGHRHAWSIPNKNDTHREARTPTLDNRTAEVPREFNPYIDDPEDEDRELTTVVSERFCPVCREVIDPGYTTEAKSQLLEEQTVVRVKARIRLDGNRIPGMPEGGVLDPQYRQLVNLWFTGETTDLSVELFGLGYLEDSTLFGSGSNMWADVTYVFAGRPGSRGQVNPVVT